MEETKNLMQALCEEIDRVKGIARTYEEQTGNAVLFASSLIRSDLAQAEKARNMGDVVEMMRWVRKLRMYKE